MGKLGCQCGHIISDVISCLPYEAELIPNQSKESFWDRIEKAIDGLVKATKNGNRTAWIQKHFHKEYPQDLNDAEMIEDLFERYYFDLSKTIFQCIKCGRIHIEKEGNKFISFKPESDEWQGILEARNDLENNLP